MTRDQARNRLAAPLLALLGTMAAFAAACGSGCNSGGGKGTRSPGAQEDADRALPGGGLLRLTPAGPDFFVWVNLEALRDWSHASKLAGPLSPALRARVSKFRSSWGIDPYRHIDRLVEQSTKLLEEADDRLERDDPVFERIYQMARTVKDCSEDVKGIVEKGTRLEDY